MREGIGTYSDQEKQRNEALLQFQKTKARIEAYKAKHKYWRFRIQGIEYEATENYVAMIRDYYELNGIAFHPDYMVERS